MSRFVAAFIACLFGVEESRREAVARTTLDCGSKMRRGREADCNCCNGMVVCIVYSSDIKVEEEERMRWWRKRGGSGSGW